MRVISFILCRDVVLHCPPAFDLMGIFLSKQTVLALPWSVSLVAFSELQFDPGEVGNHALRVCIYDPAGRQIGNFGTDIVIGPGNLNTVGSIILGIAFGSPGNYRFDFQVDGNVRTNKVVTIETSSPMGRLN